MTVSYKWHVWLSTVPLKAYSDQEWIDIVLFNISILYKNVYFEIVDAIVSTKYFSRFIID